MKVSKSEVFQMAHRLAKTFTGNYRACFALALKEVYAAIENYNSNSKFTALQERISDKFNGKLSDEYCILKSNTYPVKETLKSLGFKFEANGKSWIREFASQAEALEIASKIA